MSEHTKIPWSMDLPAAPCLINGHSHTVWQIISEDEVQGIAILILPDEDDTPFNRQLVEGNAKHILRCVNSHNAMVEALQKCERVISEMIPRSATGFSEEEIEEIRATHTVLVEARAALARLSDGGAL
jgi:hypothetical protein